MAVRFRIVQTTDTEFVVQRRVFGFWGGVTEWDGNYGRRCKPLTFRDPLRAQYHIDELRAVVVRRETARARVKAGGYPKVWKDPA